MPTAFFLSKLKPGVKPEDYERWVHNADYPLSRTIKSIKSYKVHRINGTFQGEKKYDYIEVIETSDMDAYRNDLASPVGKRILSEWSNYIGEYHGCHGEPI